MCLKVRLCQTGFNVTQHMDGSKETGSMKTPFGSDLERTGDHPVSYCGFICRSNRRERHVCNKFIEAR